MSHKRYNEILHQLNESYTQIRTSNANDLDFTQVDDKETEELMEYKQDFYNMSVGSLKAIASHASNILASLELPNVKENLTESWLQGKIAITEDYMRTIHDFIMYVSEAADNISATDRPGLWENIRRKKQREGDDYKPSKPGDPDRPDTKQWKELTKTKNTSKICAKCGLAYEACACNKI